MPTHAKATATMTTAAIVFIGRGHRSLCRARDQCPSSNLNKRMTFRRHYDTTAARVIGPTPNCAYKAGMALDPSAGSRANRDEAGGDDEASTLPWRGWDLRTPFDKVGVVVP